MLTTTMTSLFLPAWLSLPGDNLVQVTCK